MPSTEIEKQYNDLRKKHRLPDFREIDCELEAKDLEETSFLLRAIARRIAEKLEFYTTMLEELLQPDTKLYAMHESKFFEDDDKKKMYGLYKKLMALSRQSIEAFLQADEREEANFINGFISEWKKIKIEIMPYVRRMKDSWTTETDTKEDLGYLG